MPADTESLIAELERIGNDTMGAGSDFAYSGDRALYQTARNRWDAILTALRENIALRAVNAALRAKYADNWHDPPQIGDHKWVKMVFRGQGLPREFEYEGVEHDAK